MLSGKESLQDLEQMLEQAIKENDWFFVGRLEFRIEKLKRFPNRS